MFNALRDNRLLKTDSYKHSHFAQYPEGTEVVYSYIESRGGDHDKQVFFGLQAFIKEWMLDPITQQEVDVAEKIVTAHGEPFNREGWDYIVNQLGGKLPLLIKAVPEGTVVPYKNVLVTVENTDPKCFWLTSFFETQLLRAVWYPTTVATISWRIKQLIKKYLAETGTPELIDFKLHDFGGRGVSSGESAMLGGMAHLVNFMGTDTMEALVGAASYYNEPMAGFSIPAAEHSTMTILGREGEVAQMRRMIETFGKPNAIYAMVSDGYDIFNATENIIGNELKSLILEKGGTLVVRPDSGDPATVVLRVVQLLDKTFGSTVNDKGYKVLHPSVRVIQGDGINENSIGQILKFLKVSGYSADNIAFGMGGALLQQLNRDTNKFAMKCSAAKVNGQWVDVFKDPVTDKGKISKKGRFDMLNLQTVYLNGTLLVDDTLTTIRARANAA